MISHQITKEDFIKLTIILFLQNSTKCLLSKLAIERKSLNLQLSVCEKLAANITNNDKLLNAFQGEIKARLFPVSISVQPCNGRVSCESQKTQESKQQQTKKEMNELTFVLIIKLPAFSVAVTQSNLEKEFIADLQLQRVHNGRGGLVAKSQSKKLRDHIFKHKHKAEKTNRK